MNKFFLGILFLMGCGVFAQDTFTEAKYFFETGRSAQAKPLFESYLKANPNHIATLVYLGDIAAAAKKWATALDYFERVKKLKPNVAEYQYKYGGALGMVAKESNKFKALSLIDDIRTAFEKAISLDPKHIGAHWALIELNLQLPAIAGGSLKKANQYAEALAKISTVDAWLAKGHIAEYNENYKQAEQFYKNAIQVGQSKTCYQKLADLYLKMNQPEKSKATMAAYQKKSK
jgi:tetratricopeptide (TPR) repeat protein